MSATDEVNKLLRASGAMLLRDSKHEVYLLPNGNKFTRAKTSSDRRSEHNNLSDLRRALGIENQGSGPGERRERRRTAGRAEERPKYQRAAPVIGVEGLLKSALAEAVREAEAQRKRAGLWKSAARLYRTVALSSIEGTGMLSERITELEARRCPCWWCRLSARLSRPRVDVTEQIFSLPHSAKSNTGRGKR